MIHYSKIRELIASGGLATAIAMTGLRADQSSNKLAYPYFTYKVISSDDEPAHQNSFYYAASGADAMRVFSEKSSDVISLNFIDKDVPGSITAVDRLRGKATDALRWFKSRAGREFAADRDLSVMLLGTSVQDRTVYTDAYFETRLGFDIIVHGARESSEWVEAVDNIELQPSGVPDTSQIVYEAN